jgi:hypothetical protein
VRILSADDEPEDLVEVQLRSLGRDIVPARSGAEGAAFIEDPDALLGKVREVLDAPAAR